MGSEGKYVQMLAERFLTPEKRDDLSKLSKILKLSPVNLKGTTAKQALALKNHGVKTIKDLAKLPPKKLETIGADPAVGADRLQKLYLASSLIMKVYRKQGAEDEVAYTKVVVIGLDNAGKTTLIDAMRGKALNAIVNQDPTEEINQTTYASGSSNIIFWDFGGQLSYRSEYLQSPEDYFFNMDLMLFVVDVQDSDRFAEAFEYFGQILDILKYLEETPFITVMEHKADPEILEEPEIQLNLEYLDQKFKELLEPTQLPYDVVRSSIYSFYDTEPKFVSGLKNLFASDEQDPQVMLVEALTKLTENFYLVADKIVSRLDALEARLVEAVQKIPVQAPGSGGAPATPGAAPPGTKPLGAVPPPGAGASSKPGPKATPTSLRGEIMGELKELFAKRRLLSGG